MFIPVWVIVVIVIIWILRKHIKLLLSIGNEISKLWYFILDVLGLILVVLFMVAFCSLLSFLVRL